jgi:hypothetical protein
MVNFKANYEDRACMSKLNIGHMQIGKQATLGKTRFPKIPGRFELHKPSSPKLFSQNSFPGKDYVQNSDHCTYLLLGSLFIEIRRKKSLKPLVKKPC